MTSTSSEEKNAFMQERILAELKGINKVLTLANGAELEAELDKYASTQERKRAWALIDGKKDIAELEKLSGLKRRSTYDFLELLERAGLIERSRGKPPIRLIDYVP